MKDVDNHDIFTHIGLFIRSIHALKQVAKPEFGDAAIEQSALFILSRIVWDGGQRLSALAGAVHLDPSTVSRQVAALESAGLTTREPDPHDRRASLIRATEAGTALCERLRAKWHGILADILADWTDAERHDFARLCARFHKSVAARHTVATTGEKKQ